MNISFYTLPQSASKGVNFEGQPVNPKDLEKAATNGAKAQTLLRGFQIGLYDANTDNLKIMNEALKKAETGRCKSYLGAAVNYIQKQLGITPDHL